MRIILIFKRFVLVARALMQEGIVDTCKILRSPQR